MYDRNGKWQKQKVELGTAKSGARGLFTGGYMAWCLSEDEFTLFKHNREALKEYADRLGFALYEPKP